MSRMIQDSALSAFVRLCLHRSYWPQPLSDLEEGARRSTEETPVDKDRNSVILVTWHGPDDVDNPLNFGSTKKGAITALTCLYTWAIYVGSSIYTSSEPGIEEHFGVGNFESSLGLALYVLAYGLGGLLFSPLSEVPSIGRNPPYAISGALFVIHVHSNSPRQQLRRPHDPPFPPWFYGLSLLGYSWSNTGGYLGTNAVSILYWALGCHNIIRTRSGTAVIVLRRRVSGLEILQLGASDHLWLLLCGVHGPGPGDVGADDSLLSGKATQGADR